METDIKKPIVIKISEQALVARIASFIMRSKGVAIVFHRTIYLWNVSREQIIKDEAYLCHEITHILQYEREGFVKFIFKYLYYSMRFGYYNNPFEVEARNGANDKENLKKVLIQ